MGMLDVVGHAKEIADLVAAYNDMPLYRKIVDLQGEILKISESNLAYAARVNELEQHQSLAAKIKRNGNVYVGIEGNPKGEGPFCMACWDGDSKLVNLIVLLIRTDQKLVLECGRCKHKTNDVALMQVPLPAGAGRPRGNPPRF